MRNLLAAVVIVLASCATAPVITQAVPFPAPYPVARTAAPTTNPSPRAVSPSPSPSLSPAPFPLALRFTARATIYRSLVAFVRQGALTWNTALGKAVFTFDVTGRPITIDLMDRWFVTGDAFVIGRVDSIEAPHEALFYTGILTTPEAETVVLHELGHLLGCYHSPTSNDVMFYETATAKTLTAGDIAQARAHVAATLAI